MWLLPHQLYKSPTIFFISLLKFNLVVLITVVGFQSRSTKYPHLLQWYDAMDSRETYKGIKSDYVRTYMYHHDLMLLLIFSKILIP